jgi:hypothetical protein
MSEIQVWGKTIQLSRAETADYRRLSPSKRDTMRIQKYLQLHENKRIKDFAIYNEILTRERAINADCGSVSLRRLMEICKFAATRQSIIAPQLRLAARDKHMAYLLMEQNAETFLTVIHEIYDPQLPPDQWPDPGPDPQTGPGSEPWRFDDPFWNWDGMDEGFGF